VVVSVRAVYVAMIELIRRCRPDSLDLHVKVEGLTGEGVVGVEGDLFVPQLHEGDHHLLTIRSLGAELHSQLKLFVRKPIPGNLEDEIIVPFAVALVGVIDVLIWSPTLLPARAASRPGTMFWWPWRYARSP
jgi:hypothetical protein